MKPIRIICNNKGMAMLEAIPLLVIFVMLISFTLGFFGIVHTSILNSISARAYAFETFRSRTNLNYYREDGSALTGNPGPLYLGLKEFRYHAIQHEADTRGYFVPTTRSIAMGTAEAAQQTSADIHNRQIWNTVADGKRNTTINDNPVWIMVGYGICLNSDCGGNGTQQ